MYVAGDRVLYGSHGVCRVTALEQRKVDRKILTYLALEPEGQQGASYLVPTHNEVAMAKLCPLLSCDALETLLASDIIREGEWVEDGNQRKLIYRELISGGNREKLLQMLFALYRHKEARLAEGKKFHQTDDNFLRDAEKLICGEICFVLGMEFTQAREYLREKLQA